MGTIFTIGVKPCDWDPKICKPILASFTYYLIPNKFCDHLDSINQLIVSIFSTTLFFQRIFNFRGLNGSVLILIPQPKLEFIKGFYL